ncbi:putative motility protein [Roseateles koreensis]|uniref:Motility protein n=1 Tax=Roseateles koreensis TaxID=2987526 RepID=A0ABT5KRG3_9BURK|nr:putative motility protein [Roseateles koreensis]MDC8784372.1 putative motility protein [Roseateles koreensis]
MDLSSTALVNNASAAQPGTTQAAAQLLVLRKAMDLQSQGAKELLDALPTPAAPALASSGSLGTRLNLYA